MVLLRSCSHVFWKDSRYLNGGTQSLFDWELDMNYRHETMFDVEVTSGATEVA